jgi:hypothetical protein
MREYKKFKDGWEIIFPNNSKERGKVRSQRNQNELAVFKIFEAKATIEDTFAKVKYFFRKMDINQCIQICRKENEYSYYSEDEIVSVSLHVAISSFIVY